MKRQLQHFCSLVGLFLLIFCWIPGLQAQQAVLCASNDLSGTGGSVSYSVGQVAYLLNTGTEGFFIEGVQQPFEYQYHIGIEDLDGTSPGWVVYPNPAGNYIMLRIGKPDITNMRYQMYNSNGILLQSREINSHEVRITMEDFSPASYVLTVTGNDRVLQSFIIIRK